MIVLLSPAKTIDENPQKRELNLTRPGFLKEANHLVRQVKKLKKKDLQMLFGINNDLARLNYQRYQTWDNDSDNWPYNPAVLTFIGEVFRGLEAQSLNDSDLYYAQSHLRILSGLFGILKPLDNIRPYRLEMGTTLKNRRGPNLYSFWQEALTKNIRKELAEHTDRTIINLASKEYTAAINFKALKVKTINLTFKDFKNGQYKFMTAYGKNARGKMARFIIQNRIEKPEELMAFNEGGYHLNISLSKTDDLVFTRG